MTGKEQEAEISKPLVSDHNYPPAPLGDHLQGFGEGKRGERREGDGRMYLCVSLCLTDRFYSNLQ